MNRGNTQNDYTLSQRSKGNTYFIAMIIQSDEPVQGQT